MKYIPKGSYMVCRALIPRVESVIKLPNGTTTKGVTRHYLVELVGPEAANLGYAPGDLVVAKMCMEMHFYRGHRAIITTSDIVTDCKDFDLADFVTMPGEKPAEEVAKEFLGPTNGSSAEVTGAPA